MKKFIIKILLISSLLSSISYSEVINKIEINGNSRIKNETILGLANIKLNKNYTAGQINNFQKKLYESNFFKLVNFEFKNNVLFINVSENPIIDFYYINGVKSKIREDFFYNSLNLGPNKIFSEYFLKTDIEKIKNNYLEGGYLDVKILPEISQISGNALNVVINIIEGKNYKVRRVYFSGNTFFSPSTLLDVISTSEHSWWKFLSSVTNYNQNRIVFDKSLLKNFYLDNGFYDVQIISADTNFIKNKGVDLTFSINSGNKYNFSNFKIFDKNNNLRKKDIFNIKKIIEKDLKNTYSRSTLIRIQNKIINYLNLNNIEFVDLNISANKQKKNKIDITFDFYKTDRLFVNLINIKGNSITEEAVIRNNLSFSEGDTFTRKKLDDSLKKLRNTGIFSDNKITSKKIENELVDIEVNVEEQPTGSISAGLGVGSAESSIGGELKEKNLFGKGIVSNANVRFGTQKISGSINAIIPDYNNTGNKVGVSLFALSTEFDNAGYESKKIGTSAFTEYNLFEDISLNYGLGFDLDKISTNENASSLYKSRAGNYITYKTFYNIDNDKRDRNFKPTSGYKTGFGQSLAVPGSDISYLSNNVYSNFYHQIKKGYVFNVKAGLNTINSIGDDDIKLSDRNFLSSKKLRGFESYGIGPVDGKDHIGGNYSFYSTIGSTFPNPLPEKWNADSIVFIDAGNVWGVDFDSSKDSNKLRSSVGIGLDWTSPLGPLSFTYAEVLSSASTDKEESFSFQIGSSF
tara:strand:+ start:6755 stop:8992 length:2238 start_codon:yes stop_codon:yes gene_type:complete